MRTELSSSLGRGFVGIKGNVLPLHMSNLEHGLPGSSAVPVEDIEILAGQQLASVDPGLYGTEPPQNPHLLHIAHQGHDIQPLELRVDGVEPADEVLEKQLESLREAEHRVALDYKSRHLVTSVVHEFTLIGRGVGSGYRGWRIVAPRRNVVVRHGHEVQRRVVDHGPQGVQQPQARRRQRWQRVTHAVGHGDDPAWG